MSLSHYTVLLLEFFTTFTFSFDWLDFPFERKGIAGPIKYVPARYYDPSQLRRGNKCLK